MIHFVYLPTSVCLLIHPSDDFSVVPRNQDQWYLNVLIPHLRFASKLSLLNPRRLSRVQVKF